MTAATHRAPGTPATGSDGGRAHDVRGVGGRGFSDLSGEAFSAALRAAVERRGLTLDRLRHHLARRGHGLSIATLSYWQSGRSRPERPSSLAALTVLEEILEVPPGGLSGRLPSRPPADGTGGAALDDVDATLGALVASLGLDPEQGFVRSSVHERVEVRADRTVEARDVHEVIHATTSGLDRYPVSFAHRGGTAMPVLRAVANCRLGRVAEAPHEGAMAAELLLPRALRAGESLAVETRYEMRGRAFPEVFWERSVHRRTGLLLAEFRFPGGDLPLVAESYVRTAGREVSEPVRVTGPCVTVLRQDCPRGVVGLRWRWA